MKKFLKKGFVLFFPILIWALMNYLIDPFNYFSHSVVKTEAKESAESLNTLLYRSIELINNPTENLLIGDSRTAALPIKLIEDKTGKKWKKVVAFAAKLNEIFELFYWTNDKLTVKNIIIGINFNMFNKYGYQDRVSAVKEIIENPLLYLFNRDVTEASFYTLRYLIKGKNLDSEPQMSRNEFWKWNLETKATHWYGKYEFPTNLYDQLIKFDKYTSENNINVKFIIVPHQIEFHDRLVEFGLEEEEKEFKKIMYNLNAEVYGFDYANSITIDSANFSDPVHYRHHVGTILINEVFGGSLEFARTNK